MTAQQEQEQQQRKYLHETRIDERLIALLRAGGLLFMSCVLCSLAFGPVVFSLIAYRFS